ncbi:cytochrome P450 [Nonomuraea zeae]|uniref:Cytochrome P450 n=2 Tax=Nonomuraea zeae TaxID=1642303 RepID=A0A5S4GUX3_9ACTN|nr:cytochrome P450 [Nonomuraea zeae]
MRRSCPLHPPPDYARLRREEPVSRVRLPGGASAWVVARYADVRRILTDPRISADRAKPGYPFLTADAEFLRQVRVFVGMDPPEHGPYRRMFIPEFTTRRVRGLAPDIRKSVHECLDAMAAGPRPADLVTALALPVPTLAISKLLGVPDADYPRFATLTATLMAEPDPELRPQGEAGFRELVGYLSGLVATARRSPGDDLIGRVASTHVESGALSEFQLVFIALLLLFAGYETTANMITLGVVTLLAHPDQLALLHADLSLVPQAVEELLRYLSVAELATCRTAVADLEIGGVRIRAGEGVIPLAASADRDESAFAHPDRFDILRTESRHLAFGHGPHQCLGANLARLELTVVFTELLRRFPTLRLAAPMAEIPFKYDANLFGAYRLPVTW